MAVGLRPDSFGHVDNFQFAAERSLHERTKSELCLRAAASAEMRSDRPAKIPAEKGTVVKPQLPIPGLVTLY
jgi:hypothetical protein